MSKNNLLKFSAVGPLMPSFLRILLVVAYEHWIYTEFLLVYADQNNAS